MSRDRSSRIYGALVRGRAVLEIVVITAIAYMVHKGSIYPSTSLIAAAAASRLAGLDITPAGYLAAITISIAQDIGSVIPVYIIGLVASLVTSYLAIKAPRELQRYKALESLRIIALILLALPLSQYSWLAATMLRPWDPFPLGSLILAALAMLITVILRGGRDLEQILEPLARSPEGLSKAYLYIARLLTITASIALAIATTSPAPLVLLIVLIAITRIAIKRIYVEGVEAIIEMPIPLAILLYTLILRSG